MIIQRSSHQKMNLRRKKNQHLKKILNKSQLKEFLDRNRLLAVFCKIFMELASKRLKVLEIIKNV